MKKILWSLIFGAMIVFHAPVFADDADDEVPDVTARVSRISFIRGDVQIKRTGNDEWEKAVLNLPIVEGDEIATGPEERLEIQLNIYSYVRLSENSYLKVVGLQDGSVALSLSEGTMTVRLTEFDKDSAFFEIDAPRTTIAVQKAGMYRIDAGKTGSDEVRVTVTNEGEARVYAENSGFTLRDGRAGTVKIEGPLAGEWDTAAASFFYDEFDAWSVDRDVIIAKRLQDAHYDKYYDRDIYGAEDLNDNGEWVYSTTYGNVWRPHRSSISGYADWSPYRYGHWRWVPPYGWTWVNDEPWGWATYHHGRWFYDRGYWYWSPYGQVRRSRSWWAPALVGITIVRNTVCWYPLPYGHNYYNYNYYYGGWGGPRGPRGGHHGGPRGNQGPAPTPTPAPALVKGKPRLSRQSPVLDTVPTVAVVTLPLSSFGRGKTGAVQAPPVQAKEALTRALSQADPVRILPTFQELDGNVSPAIKPAKPRNTALATKPTGAATRNADGQPMDRVLQSTKIFGDRQPVRQDPVRQQPVMQGEAPPRKTGAVIRVPVPLRAEEDPVRQAPRDVVPVKPNRQPPSQPDPVYSQPTKPRIDRQPEPVRQPQYTPPPQQKERADPVRQQPQNSPPPTRREPQRKNDPPPTRSEPTKSEPSKSEPAPTQRKGKG